MNKEACWDVPVLLIHGIFDTSAAMRSVSRSLKRHGWRAVYAIDLRPNDGSAPLADLARQVENRVEEICLARQVSQLDIVAFSMGGLVARHYVKFLEGHKRVRQLVTISSPHHGTWMANLGPGAGAREMRPGSAFLEALNAGEEAPGPVRYTSIWTPMDLMIVPPESSELRGARNISLINPAHPAMLWDRRVLKAVREALLGDGEPTYEPG